MFASNINRISKTLRGQRSDGLGWMDTVRDVRV